MDDERTQLGQASLEASKLEPSWETQSRNEHQAPGREGRSECVPGAISPPGSRGGAGATASASARRLAGLHSRLCAPRTRPPCGATSEPFADRLHAKCPFPESRQQLRSRRQSHALLWVLLPLRRELAAPPCRRVWGSGAPKLREHGVRASRRRKVSGRPAALRVSGALCSGSRSGRRPGNDFQMVWKEP